MTLLRALMISAVAILAAGCSQTSGAGCDGWKPLRPTAHDIQVMSSKFVGDVLEHNEFGADRGCWRRP